MVTKKLKEIFLITLIPIYLHGIEEIFTGFAKTDYFMQIGASFLQISPHQFYWISHLLFWVSLPLLYLLFNKKKVAIYLFSLFSVFFVVELHHIIKAIFVNDYYPGLLTALIYPIIGVFYYKELIASWRKNYGRG